jgi:cell division transport system permease protein
LFDRLEFVISEALIALRRNRWMTFATITTVCMALFLLGGLSYLFMSVSNSAAQLQKKIEIQVFLKPKASVAEYNALRQKVQSIAGVSEVRFLSKEEAWTQYEKQYPEVTKDIDNPFPDQFAVTLSSLNHAPTVAKAIEKMGIAETDGIKYLDEERRALQTGMSTLRWLGTVLVTVMLFTSGILIYNTIRMTIVARAKEMKIMELVGATRRTILTPMVIEGVGQGVIGGFLAALILWGSFIGVMRFLEGMQSQPITAHFPAFSAILLLSLLGAVYGLFCSFLAIRRVRQVV